MVFVLGREIGKKSRESKGGIEESHLGGRERKRVKREGR